MPILISKKQINANWVNFRVIVALLCEIFR